MRARNIGGLQQVKAAAAAASFNNDNLCGKKKNFRVKGSNWKTVSLKIYVYEVKN